MSMPSSQAVPARYKGKPRGLNGVSVRAGVLDFRSPDTYRTSKVVPQQLLDLVNKGLQPRPERVENRWLVEPHNTGVQHRYFVLGRANLADCDRTGGAGGAAWTSIHCGLSIQTPQKKHGIPRCRDRCGLNLSQNGYGRIGPNREVV